MVSVGSEKRCISHSVNQHIIPFIGKVLDLGGLGGADALNSRFSDILMFFICIADSL